MFCWSCGVRVDENAHFCSNCGKLIKNVTEPKFESLPAEEPKQSNAVAVVAFILSLIFLVLALVVSEDASDVSVTVYGALAALTLGITGAALSGPRQGKGRGLSIWAMIFSTMNILIFLIV